MTDGPCLLITSNIYLQFFRRFKSSCKGHPLLHIKVPLLCHSLLSIRKITSLTHVIPYVGSPSSFTCLSFSCLIGSKWPSRVKRTYYVYPNCSRRLLLSELNILFNMVTWVLHKIRSHLILLTQNDSFNFCALHCLIIWWWQV